jgi:uncharacterized membrane protein YfcA
MKDLLLSFAGFVAGAIDSIAGGGGLITLPTLAWAIEPGAHAIGTNKIVGTSGALIAFLVYLRKHPLNLKKGTVFLAATGIGSVLGSLCSPLVPKIWFRYLLLAVCPLVLWMLMNKKVFMQEAKDHGAHMSRKALGVLFATGAGVGFYDGFFGPGGGTFMLLGLLWAAKLPLFEALLLSKLANAISAGVSLVSYGFQGFVHPEEGLIMASGMVVGGFLGARFASQRAEKVVKPVLAAVVTLLLLVQLKEIILAG